MYQKKSNRRSPELFQNVPHTVKASCIKYKNRISCHILVMQWIHLSLIHILWSDVLQVVKTLLSKIQYWNSSSRFYQNFYIIYISLMPTLYGRLMYNQIKWRVLKTILTLKVMFTLVTLFSNKLLFSSFICKAGHCTVCYCVLCISLGLFTFNSTGETFQFLHRHNTEWKNITSHSICKCEHYSTKYVYIIFIWSISLTEITITCYATNPCISNVIITVTHHYKSCLLYTSRCV